MFSVEAETLIDAPPEAVFSVLVDLERYDEWCSVVRYVGGEVGLGEEIEIEFETGEATLEFAPTVNRLEENRAFGWIDGAPIRWLFEGEHVFRLEPAPGGKTRLTNREAYRGLIGSLARWIPAVKGAEARFQTMNEELKAHVEATSSTKSAPAPRERS